MQSLGIDVLFKGVNMFRLLGGLWVAIRISLISVGISIVLGVIMGVIMSGKNKIAEATGITHTVFLVHLRKYATKNRSMPRFCKKQPK